MAAAMALAAGAALAAPGDGTSLVFLGADPAEGRPGEIGAELSVLALPRLPEEGAAGTEVLAALLRARPVSTLVAAPEAAAMSTGDFHLVADLALSGGDGTVEFLLGGDALAPEAFATRLAALVDAFAPERRQIAFVRVQDPDDLLPGALDRLRAGLDAAGMSMAVVMVGESAETCGGPRQAIHYAILGGLADRAPFGDGDAVTTAAEAGAWAGAALAREVERGAPCAARYSLILTGQGDPARAVAEHGGQPLIPAMESAVYMEGFEALFLRDSDDPEAISAYLASCAYCPLEDELQDRLREIGERETALALETGVWEQIREDATPERLEVYLENCQLCAWEDEARARIAEIEAAEAARAMEAATLAALTEARDLAGLRDWLASCTVCDQREAAEAALVALESDAAVQAEEAALDAAIGRRNAGEIAAWLDSCTVCGGRDRAEAELDQLTREAEAAAPCIAAAGLPQQGGPRLLAEIDVEGARGVCARALDAFPENPVARTALGRAEQAAGDMAAALAAYEAGMAAGLPQAFGLAAHMAYAPGEGGTADYVRAASLAEQGLAGGDWLSGEVLTVLYSRELVAGKGPNEAYAIARAMAEEGNPVAQFFTGYFHRVGTGADLDDAAAAEWFGRAVDQGYLHANSFLAEMLETGSEAVPADPVRAADLYWSALVAGDPTARERLTAGIGDRPQAVVLEIQGRLRDEGVFNGRVDGIGGPNTASAVERFAEVRETAE